MRCNLMQERHVLLKGHDLRIDVTSAVRRYLKLGIALAKAVGAATIDAERMRKVRVQPGERLGPAVSASSSTLHPSP